MSKEEIALNIMLKYLDKKEDTSLSYEQATCFPDSKIDHSCGQILAKIYQDIYDNITV